MTARVSLVTGGGGAIGASIAKLLAERGDRVMIGDIDEQAAEAVAAALRDMDFDARARVLDVTSAESWSSVLDAASDLGDLWTVVNNAGTLADVTLRKMTERQWNDVIGVHLSGAFLGCQAALRMMVPLGAGRIVNMSSIAYLGSFGQANYAAAKGGIVSLTRTAALEGARYGITANAVAPGNVDTPMLRSVPLAQLEEFVAAVPLRRAAHVDEIADVVGFLSSDAASYVTGQVLHVDGGVTAGV